MDRTDSFWTKTNKITKFSILDKKKQISQSWMKCGWKLEIWTKIRNLDNILDEIGDFGWMKKW